MGRIIGNGLAAQWPQPVVADNRPGAGTSLGASYVAKAKPDGYTLLASGIASHAINPVVYQNVGYDPVSDFTPVTLVATLPNVVLVNPDLPVRNVTELISLLRESPEQYNYASVGNGTSPHLSAELLMQSAGLKIQHIPYNGSAPMLVDLVSGVVSIGFDNVSGAAPLVKSGKLRALAVTSKERSHLLPDVPPVLEAPGLERYEVSSWLGLHGPANMPSDVLSKISQDAMRFLSSDDAKEKIRNAGGTASPMTPDEFGAFVESQVTKFREIARRANLQLG